MLLTENFEHFVLSEPSETPAWWLVCVIYILPVSFLCRTFPRRNGKGKGKGMFGRGMKGTTANHAKYAKGEIKRLCREFCELPRMGFLNPCLSLVRVFRVFRGLASAILQIHDNCGLPST